MTKWMTDEGGFSAAEVKAIDDQVKAEVAEAVKFAEDSPYPTPESGVEDVYSDIVEEVRDR